MLIPLIRSQIFTILRSCHHEAEYNHDDNWDYYSMVEDYLSDWYEGEDRRVKMIGTPLGGKVPKLSEKENRICSIIEKITYPPIVNDFTVHGTDFTAEEVETIIELLKQYSADIDIVVVMGLKRDYNTLSGWINESTLCVIELLTFFQMKGI